MSLQVHCSLTEPTQRSANAFKLGPRPGRVRHRIPLDWSTSAKALQTAGLAVRGAELTLERCNPGFDILDLNRLGRVI
jgi:hypothetical protein